MRHSHIVLRGWASRGFRWYVLVLCCALFMLASLVFVAGSTRAGTLTAGPHAAIARADLGYPPSLDKLRHSQYRVPAGSASAAANPVKSQPPGQSCWSVVDSPNPDLILTLNTLVAVDSASPNDIWAVGNYCSSGCATDSEVDSTLVEHYGHDGWRVVSSPNVGTDFNTLGGVAVLNPHNVWAVGNYFDDTSGHFQTLIEHFDGRAWSIVSSPNPGPLNNYLNSVAAISPNDIWAVGNYRAYQGGPFISMAMHYDGTSWTVVPTPNPGAARDQLVSVTALGPNDVWAVGNACDTGDCFASAGRTLTEHWDGHNWSVVPSPNAGAGSNNFNAVSASKPNDVWAVGYYCVDGDCNAAQPLIEHYDGASWSVASDSVPGSVNSQYEGVLAISPKNVWASGSFSSDGSTWTNLMAHYDGRSWSLVPVMSPGAFNNDLWGLTAVGSNNVWAVGDYDNGPDYPLGRTQVQHYDGPCH